jgi:hypothetical protein
MQFSEIGLGARSGRRCAHGIKFGEHDGYALLRKSGTSVEHGL